MRTAVRVRLRRRAFLLAVSASAACAGCARSGSEGSDAYVPPADPHEVRLGAHTLLTHEEGAGTSPAVTAPIATQNSGSSLIAFTAGYAANDAPPTDSWHNAWSALGAPVVYAGYQGRFDVRAYVAMHARGGDAHVLSVPKPGRPGGEISIPFVEIRNAGRLQDVAQSYAPVARHQASASVTTTGPATLVAFWWGDGAFLEQSARPDDGFAIIENFVNLPPGSAVQCVVAARQVETAGTYRVHWSVAPAQGAPLWLFAFQRDDRIGADAAR